MNQKYISILDCEICKNLPQKASEDLKHDTSESKFPKLDKLLPAIKIEEETDSAYVSSTTIIYKCPLCGTYYYFNHFEDEGTHFMDPTYDEMTFRRYDFPTVKRFLEGIAGVKDGTVPHALGTLKKAFLDGSTPSPTQVQGADTKIESATKELLELNHRYADSINDLISCLKKEIPNLNLKIYIIDSLCHHFMNEGNLDIIDNLLLKHENVFIRVRTANYLAGISTTDAPVSDLIHIPRKFLEASKAFISDKKYITELKEIFLSTALSSEEIIYEYDDGYNSRRYKKPLQYDALYGLRVIVKYIDLSKDIPKIVGLFSTKDRALNDYASWLLRELLTSKANAVAIREEIEKFAPKIAEDKNIQELLKECNKKIRINNPKGAPIKARAKQPKGSPKKRKK